MPNYYKLKMIGLMKNDTEQKVQVVQWNKQTGQDDLVRECPKGIELNFNGLEVKESQYGKCVQLNFTDDTGDKYSYYSKLGKNMRTVLMKMSGAKDKIKKVVLCPSNYQGFNFIQVQVNGEYMKNPYPKEDIEKMIKKVQVGSNTYTDDTEIVDFILKAVIPIIEEKTPKEGDFFWEHGTEGPSISEQIRERNGLNKDEEMKVPF